MQIYNVDFKRLALLLVPTVLRKPIIFAILKSAVKSYESLQGNMFSYRQQCDVRITHTPQTCYIKGILNDTFCEGTTEHFDIVDTESIYGEWLITYQENHAERYEDIIPVVDTEEYTIIYTENAINEITEDFVVLFPSGVGIAENNDSYRRMIAIVNEYRLSSKKPQYQLQMK